MDHVVGYFSLTVLLTYLVDKAAAERTLPTVDIKHLDTKTIRQNFASTLKKWDFSLHSTVCNLRIFCWLFVSKVSL
jgi:hypothetical protein